MTAIHIRPAFDGGGDMLAERACANSPWNADVRARRVLPSPFPQYAQEILEIVMTQRHTDQQRARVADLNDQARAAMGVACIVETTPGFRRLNDDDQMHIKAAVARYDLWTIGESHDEARDFGAIFKQRDGDWSQETPRGGDPITAIFWSITCFDPAQTRISEHPWDQTRCIRVLTLMLATEY